MASLKLLAKFSGNIVVVDFGLPNKIVVFLIQQGVSVIPFETKWGIQNLDFLHTICNHFAEGIIVFWDHSCYVQTNIDKVFELADSENLICCRGNDPQLGNKLFSFGYKEDITATSEVFVRLLKKISRLHSKPLGASFLAGRASTLLTYVRHITVCVETNFLSVGSQTHQAALNLFAWNYGVVDVVDNCWCQPVTGDLEWRDDGFYRNNNQVKVICVPKDHFDGFYQFSNRFVNLHNQWMACYNGCSFDPKRIMKPSLTKIKKVT